MGKKRKRKQVLPNEYRKKKGYKLVGGGKHGVLWLTQKEIIRAKHRMTIYRRKHVN